MLPHRMLSIDECNIRRARTVNLVSKGDRLMLRPQDSCRDNLISHQQPVLSVKAIKTANLSIQAYQPASKATWPVQVAPKLQSCAAELTTVMEMDLVLITCKTQTT